MGKLTYVPVGTDRFRAQLIAEACQAAGLEVELLTADDSGTFTMYGEIQPHRLLVRSQDLERVQMLVGESSDIDHPDHPVTER
jgi:hypothetical protein